MTGRGPLRSAIPTRRWSGPPRAPFIQVAAGEYSGKLEIGTCEINLPQLTLLGGHDDGFTVRAPWRTPSVLRRQVVTRDEDHSGTVLDGFVIDARSTAGRWRTTSSSTATGTASGGQAAEQYAPTSE